MKKHLLCAGALACALFLPAVASAESTGYGQFTGGLVPGGKADVAVTLPGVTIEEEPDVKPGWFFSFAYGLKHDNGLALEGELLGVGAGVDTVFFDKAEIQAAAFMANVRYDVKTGGAMTPYVGVGAGFGHVVLAADGGADNTGGVLWQARAGVAFTDGAGRTWDVGYRYIAPPELDVRDEAGIPIKAKARLHVLAVGLRF